MTAYPTELITRGQTWEAKVTIVVLDRAALRRKRSDNDPVDAGPGDRDDMIGDFLDSPSEGQRVNMTVGD